jgi:hypothetical protein
MSIPEESDVPNNIPPDTVRCEGKLVPLGSTKVKIKDVLKETQVHDLIANCPLCGLQLDRVFPVYGLVDEVTVTCRHCKSPCEVTIKKDD